MVATMGRGRRLSRRRALSFVIGWFAGLVLSGAWTHKEVFWWPAFGAERPEAPLLPPLPLLLALEVNRDRRSRMDLDALRSRGARPARVVLAPRPVVGRR